MLAISTANRVGVLKEANRRLVLSCIRKEGPISQSDITLRTKLSRPTVVNIVRDLARENLIKRAGYGESLGGRSPVLYAFNFQSSFTIGIEFEFPRVRMVIADLNHEPVISSDFSFSLDDDQELVVHKLVNEISDLIGRSGCPKETFLGVGLGLPGLIDSNQGTSVLIERISGWRDVAIRQILEENLEMPVYIRNDVHLMSLVEHEMNGKNLGLSAASFVYIGMRHSKPQHGIGMSIIMDGHVYEGLKGNAGFFGHMTLMPDGPPCVCGHLGCLETLVGQRAIEKYMSLRQETRRDDKEVTGDMVLKDLVRLSNNGDANASEVLREAGRYLGMGIANVIKLLEIPTVVIGGIPDLEASVLIGSIRETVGSMVYSNVKDELRILCGSCTEEHYALGGCRLVVDESFDGPELNLEMTGIHADQ